MTITSQTPFRTTKRVYRAQGPNLASGTTVRNLHPIDLAGEWWRVGTTAPAVLHRDNIAQER